VHANVGPAKLMAAVFPEIWPQSLPGACLFEALGLGSGQVVPFGAAAAYMHFHELGPSDTGPRVLVKGECASVVEGALLPIGHQHTEYDVNAKCPALADASRERPPRLAAVALLVSSGRVLLTRRPRTMRTFPGAWVLPGGSVDSTDESLRAAALRELAEETGVVVPEDAANLAPLGFWESCYPTSVDSWKQARLDNGRRAHHLVAFFEVHSASASELELKLSSEEVDAACWVRILYFSVCTRGLP